MSINLKMPEIKELRPKITVFGVGGAGGNAVNNMIRSGLQGCDFVVANTDSQALSSSRAEHVIQMGVAVTEGLGAGSQPEVGRAAAEEAIAEITEHLAGSHMVFVTAGMGGGTGTGAAPIVARVAREHGILTVGVVTKPFHFEGVRRMRVADSGIKDLEENVDTLIVIPNQNLFRIANEKTTFADAFAMADQVLYSGVACITDLMVKEGLINLDFADVRSVMREMGKAMMGTGEASGDRRATQAAEAAIANPLLDETSMRGARGLLISITGGKDLTLFEVDEAATRIREEVDPDANIILGATFEESLEGVIRVSVVATGISNEAGSAATPVQATTPVTGADQLAARLRAATAKSLATPALKPAAPAAQPTATVRPLPEAAPIQAPAEPPQAIMQPPPRQAPQPQPQYLEDHLEPDEALLPEDEDIDAEAPFIPPEPEAPTRVPRVEDFPPHTQRQIEAHHNGRRGDYEDRGPMSLLRRLASVGLGRREDDHPDHGAEPRAPKPISRPQQRQIPPQPRAAQPKAQRQEAPYRPAQGDLDPQGRKIPATGRPQEDDLEIPAFLRRQAK